MFKKTLDIGATEIRMAGAPSPRDGLPYRLFLIVFIEGLFGSRAWNGWGDGHRDGHRNGYRHGYRCELLGGLCSFGFLLLGVNTGENGRHDDGNDHGHDVQGD